MENQTTTCQICGRLIKSNTGLIAHHGYKRPGNGWQTSSCMGARHLPYEQSCDLIPVAIQRAADFITGRQTWLETFKAAPPAVLTYEKYAGAWNKTITTEVTKPDGFDPTARRRTYQSGAYDTVYFGKVTDAETAIRFAQSDLAFLTKRLADWKAPQPAE